MCVGWPISSAYVAHFGQELARFYMVGPTLVETVERQNVAITCADLVGRALVRPKSSQLWSVLFRILSSLPRVGSNPHRVLSDPASNMFDSS